jgi:hypothetical protein
VVLLVLSSNLPLHSAFIFGVDWTQTTKTPKPNHPHPDSEGSDCHVARFWRSIMLSLACEIISFYLSTASSVRVVAVSRSDSKWAMNS